MKIQGQICAMVAKGKQIIRRSTFRCKGSFSLKDLLLLLASSWVEGRSRSTYVCTLYIGDQWSPCLLLNLLVNKQIRKYVAIIEISKKKSNIKIPKE